MMMMMMMMTIPSRSLFHVHPFFSLFFFFFVFLYVGMLLFTPLEGLVDGILFLLLLLLSSLSPSTWHVGTRGVDWHTRPLAFSGTQEDVDAYRKKSSGLPC